MFKSRKSLENGMVFIVFDEAECVGVYSSEKEAKRCCIIKAFNGINTDHYNPADRYKKCLRQMSLSKEPPILWDDMWKQSGVPDVTIQVWYVDTRKYCTLYCTLDKYIKNHIVANQLSWSQVQHLLNSWKTMSNMDSMYDSCFATEQAEWEDTSGMSVTSWNTRYYTECHHRHLTRHLSLMKHRSKEI